MPNTVKPKQRPLNKNFKGTVYRRYLEKILHFSKNQLFSCGIKWLDVWLNCRDMD